MQKNELWLTIPTGERRDYLNDIIENSGIPKNRVVIVHTTDMVPMPGVHNVYTRELNIQRWWNIGIKFALANGGTHVAILNDDVVLIDYPLQKIYEGMLKVDATIGYPVPSSSTPCGYCFILNTKHNIFPDENYHWWYGDNDLYDRAKSIIGISATVMHKHPNELTSNSPELMALAMKDKERYLSGRD